jgi:hypothetical protein
MKGSGMNLEELASRLAGAVEGSRELDAKLAAAAMAGGTAYYVTDGDRPQDAAAGEWLVVRRTEDGQVVTHRPPRYTSSLDAAVSLVPKTMGWELTFKRRDHVYAAGIAPRRTPETGRYETHAGQAKTAPLALCSAALRARHATEPQPGEKQVS